MKHRKPLSILLALVMLLALLPAFALTAHAAEVDIDYVHFPDPLLMNYVKVNFDTDHNDVLSDAEIAAAKEITINDDALSSLEGIGFLTALEELNCCGSSIGCSVSFVDLSQNPNLTYVALALTNITALDLSANPLVETLWCDQNEFLTSVKLSGCDKLAKLHANYCSALTELDISACPILVDVYKNGIQNAVGSPEYWQYKNGINVVEVDKSVNVLVPVTITFDPHGGSGTMADVTVTKGASYTLPDCGFEAPAGKYFDTWDIGAVGDTITVDADMTIEPQWKDIMVWNISFDANGGAGTMEGATVVVGTKYTLPACTFTAPEGKVFDKWEQGAPGDEIDVDADLSVVAVWKDKPAETWAISFDANGGTGTMAATTVVKGEKYKLPECAFTAPEGKVFDKWDAGAVSDEIEVTADLTLKAIWKDKPAETWAISFDADGGTGTMADVKVNKGEKYKLPECTFTAPAGKEFDKWEQGKPGDEIAVTADLTVKAVWKDKAPEKKANPFKDVFETDYFYDAVIWAYYAEPQVTNGMSADEFGPKSTVTRGQAVTFLWRAMGKPEPTATANPFEDVPDTEYYYKAVLWAVEKGITNGTDATHFTPNQTCSTAHILTFLYRTITGQPNAGWYEVAAGWAQGAGLMGDLKITVSPETECPRADVVYFLYRALAK